MVADGPRAALRIRDLELRFGMRTYVMGIINVTPDSFSGDGLLRDRETGDDPSPADPADADGAAEAAVAQAVRMVEEGADLLDVGGKSTRPGHEPVDEPDERRRVAGVIAAIRARLPGVPISVDTSKPGVADAALDAGADLINDVTAVTGGARLAPLAAARGVHYILMHSRAHAEYGDVVREVVDDLRTALRAAHGAGCALDRLIVDPGIGFGKTAQQNLQLLAGLGALRELGQPILLGTSRKSTIGQVLGLPVDQRLEGTLATTALGIAAGVDIVRVHDVAANVRAARMSDAIVRGGWHDARARPRSLMDRIVLRAMRYEGRLGATEEERAFPQLVEVDLEVEADLTAATETDELAVTVDYGPLVALTAKTVEGGSFHLLEGLAGDIARGALASSALITAVTVRVRKLAVPLDVDMDHAEVEIRRTRA